MRRRFVDVLMSAVLSLLLAWVQLFLTARQRVVTNIFEIGTAGIISFLAVSACPKGNWTCVCSFLQSALWAPLGTFATALWYRSRSQLQRAEADEPTGQDEDDGGLNQPSAGADLDSRSVWAIVYTLFLSFAISIGSEVYDSFGPSQPSASETSTDGSALDTVTVQGSFRMTCCWS
jgi:hypothetical protein